MVFIKDNDRWDTLNGKIIKLSKYNLLKEGDNGLMVKTTSHIYSYVFITMSRSQINSTILPQIPLLCILLCPVYKEDVWH